MNDERTPGAPRPSGTDTPTLSPVDGTHNLRVPAPAPVHPHTDESITPDSLPPLRAPLAQGALLLAIYVAMYGAMGLVIEATNALTARFAAPGYAPVRDDAVQPGAAARAFASLDAELACARA